MTMMGPHAVWHRTRTVSPMALRSALSFARSREVETSKVAKKEFDQSKLDRLVAQARRDAAARETGYRERALKMYPWVCGRCAREFTRSNLQELTVHHRNHDHDFNPADGSNWELLCVYCHDNEHSRYIDHTGESASGSENRTEPATSNPFAGLKDLLRR